MPTIRSRVLFKPCGFENPLSDNVGPLRKMNMKNKIPDFSGKIVSLSTADSILTTQNPHFEQQGGRLFVVGIVPKGGSRNNWAQGTLSAVAWDAVTDYLVFNSEKEYTVSLRKSRKKK